jgi:hypothetical protein
MIIELDKFPENDFSDEPTFDPELIDPELAQFAKPSISFSKESHMIIIHNGIGYFI